MNKIKREKLATEVDAEILSAVRELAETEGQQIQNLIDEALTDLLEKRRISRPRDHVMSAYKASHGRYRELYKKLAE